MGNGFEVRRASTILMLSLTSLIVASCNRHQSASNGFVDLSNPDVAQIVQIAKDFEQWNKSGDVEHIVDIYSSDVIYMHGGMPNLEGRPAVAESYRDFFSSYTQVNVKVQEVRVFGDMAFDRATFVTTVTPKGWR